MERLLVRRSSSRTSRRPAVRRQPKEPEGIALGFQAVKTALEHKPAQVERVMLARRQRDARTQQIVRLAREAGIPFGEVPRDGLDRLAAGARHQGIVAKLSGVPLVDPFELIEQLPEQALALALDGVNDPRNLGAVIRSAAAFGADGIFLPSHNSAGLSPAAMRTSAGGALTIPIARGTNISRLLDTMIDRQIEPVALDACGGQPPWQVDLTGPIVLVVGGEEKGIRRAVRERCQTVVTLPLTEKVASLNLSVAAGAVLAEATRQRQKITI